MRCRKLQLDERGKQTIVWFNSYGVEVRNTTVNEEVFVVSKMQPEYVRSNYEYMWKEYNSIRLDIDNIYINKEADPVATITINFPGQSLDSVYNICIIDKKDNIYQLYTSANAYQDSQTINLAKSYFTERGIDLENIEIKKVIIWYHNMYGRELPVNFTGDSMALNYIKMIKYKLSADGNYSEKQQSVRDALIQTLSVIKGELWYKASYGLPLLDKVKNKGIYDSVIINIILENPDVVSITKFNSKIENRIYTFNFVCNTIYGDDLEVQLSL